ncbi:MAG: PQQ-dependent sugar dehydrogenase [Acidimicrobiia bacterium]
MRGLATLIVFALVAASCSEAAAPGEPQLGTTAVATSRPAAPVGPGTTTTDPPATTSLPTTAPSTTLPPLRSLGADVVTRELDKPVFAVAPRGDDRLFVVEQDGLIRLVVDEELVTQPFLDIDSLVGSRNLEQGLLGLAFHPSYAANGRFFVYYTDNEGHSRLVEYSVSDDPNRADPESAKFVLGENQPASNHNAGMLAFGPDGYLYVGLGDGGGANDQFGNGQRTDTLLGTILRLDIDAADPYAVPPDNPFVGGGGAAEVWAYGLRNPWRFSIDGDVLYIGDVGQNDREEVDVIPLSAAGTNFGWPIFEGTACLGGDECQQGDFTGPIIEFNHAEGCSIIGGPVYRGEAIPELAGHFFYSDWCGGFLRSFRLDGDTAADQTDWTPDVGTLGQVLSLGTDGAGEIYAMNAEGYLYKFVPVR